MKPNILFLMCDQLQADAVRDRQCITPTFDYLSSIGMTFDRAYTPNPVCSPARASIMTGLLPHNHGVLCVTHNVDDDQACLRTEHVHWAQRLKEQGYVTAYFGKWHVERTEDLEKFGWTINGREKSAIFRKKAEELGARLKDKNLVTAKYVDKPEGYPPRVLYGVTDIKPEQRMMGVTGALAVDFLEEYGKRDEPWCCFVSIKEPHDPYICGKDAFEMYDADNIELPDNASDSLEGRPNLYKKASLIFSDMTEQDKKMAKACYYASVTEIDKVFGTIIDKLRSIGQLENTIIILTSDHGDNLGSHGLYCKNIMASEEIYNVPLIMAGPGIQKGVRTDARVGTHDLCQTILSLTGCEPIDTNDSASFAEVLTDCRKHEDRYQKGFAEYYGGRIWLTQRVVWDGNWKFVFNGFDFDELYNLKDDPGEMNNLAGNPEYTGVVKKMCSYMWSVINKTNDHSLYKSEYPILRVAPFGPLTAEENDSF